MKNTSQHRCLRVNHIDPTRRSALKERISYLRTIKTGSTEKRSPKKRIKSVPQGQQNRLYRKSAQQKPNQHLEVNNTGFT